MDKPILTILMTVYNGEPYVSEAVESILNQTYSDFRFLILDNASTDNTREIIRAFNDSRIDLIPLPENIGIVAALNRGLQMIDTPFVARMDADDACFPTRLAAQVDFLSSHPEVGVLGTIMEIMDRFGKTFRIYKVPLSHSMIAWTLLFGKTFAHPSVMFRKSLIRRTGGYDPDFTYAEDLELWTRLVECTRFANLSTPLSRLRVHENSSGAKYLSEQRTNALRIRQRFASNLLGRDVAFELIESLHKSQLQNGLLSDIQLKQVTALIIDLYRAAHRKGLFIKEEIDEVYGDMLGKIAKATQCLIKHTEQTKIEKEAQYAKK